MMLTSESMFMTRIAKVLRNKLANMEPRAIISRVSKPSTEEPTPQSGLNLLNLGEVEALLWQMDVEPPVQGIERSF